MSDTLNKIPLAMIKDIDQISIKTKPLPDGDWNSALENGIYTSTLYSGNENAPMDGWLIGHVMAYDDNYVFQELMNYTSGKFEHFTRSKVGGVWGEWMDVDSKLNSHLTQDATKDKKGHVQIGDGLVVENGVVSAQSFYDTSKTLDNASTDYKNGITVTPVNTNSSDALQIQIMDLINNMMGWTLPYAAFRFVLTTTRRDNLNVLQEISVFSNFTNIIGYEVARLVRCASFSDPYDWFDWRLSIVPFTYAGNPNGNLFGLKGWVCQDITNGTMYIKTTGLTGATNSGWVEIGSDTSA